MTYVNGNTFGVFWRWLSESGLLEFRQISEPVSATVYEKTCTLEVPTHQGSFLVIFANVIVVL